jgi:hypothetical protein
MSRDLSSIERRICRVVFAFLGAMVFVFLLLDAIQFLSHSSPPLTKLRADAGNTGGRPRQAIQPSSDSQAARSDAEMTQSAPDDRASASLSAAKALSASPENSALETAIRFDPQRVERRLYETSLVSGRGLLRLSPAEVPAKIPSTESFERPQGGGPIVTPTFATAEPRSAPPSESLAPGAQGEPGSELVPQIQARLRDLGFLSSPIASGAWNTGSRAALRDFKVVNHLADDDVWDLQTGETLASQTAVRADQSFIGSWSKAPCRSASKDNLRLIITARRVRSSAGAVCEFHDFAPEEDGWRVRTTCSQGNQRWKTDGKFAVRENKLIWTSEGDVNSYFRCEAKR